MKTNRGKGYFYSLGSREAARGHRKSLKLRTWPRWAKLAYAKGYSDTTAWNFMSPSQIFNVPDNLKC